MNFSKLKLILLGASTGGPGLIEKIISSFESSLEGSIVLAQHMDKVSLASFAKRLNRINPLTEVVFCEEKTKIVANKIYLLDATSFLKEGNSQLFLEPDFAYRGIYHPTIDKLFNSGATLSGYEIRAYLLSGIGADGAKGLLQLKEHGCRTIAQDEKSSIVYGMPKAAKELDAASSILSIEDIIKDIHVFMA